MKERKNESIGGGYFVFRRGKKTGRIGCKTPWVPFEHDSEESAREEADRLSLKLPGESFEVFESAGYIARHEPES